MLMYITLMDSIFPNKDKSLLENCILVIYVSLILKFLIISENFKGVCGSACLDVYAHCSGFGFVLAGACFFRSLSSIHARVNPL